MTTPHACPDDLMVECPNCGRVTAHFTLHALICDGVIDEQETPPWED